MTMIDVLATLDLTFTYYKYIIQPYLTHLNPKKWKENITCKMINWRHKFIELGLNSLSTLLPGVIYCNMDTEYRHSITLMVIC